MYPGTYVNDMHLLAMALQEPASPNEPMIIQFCTYMYAYENLKDPDDFQVFLLHFTRTCIYLCFNSIQRVHTAHLHALAANFSLRLPGRHRTPEYERRRPYVIYGCTR